MRTKGLLLLLLYAIAMQYAEAQNNPFLKDFGEFRKEVRSDYENFRDEANRKYSDLLRESWKSQKVLKEQPKPKDEERPPVVMNEDLPVDPIKSVPVKIDEVVACIPKSMPQPQPLAPLEENKSSSEETIGFGFFGTPLKVRFNSQQHFKLTTCSNEEIANIWQQLTKSDLDNTLFDCLTLRTRHELNDWAYLLMLDSLSRACMGAGNEATLMLSYLYQQSGYKMRLAKNNGQLVLLYATTHNIYGQFYFNMDNIHYYIYGVGSKRKPISATEMTVCEASFPKERPMSLWLDNTPLLHFIASPDRILASKKYPEMNVHCAVNKNLIDFFNCYPASMDGKDQMTRWLILAKTPFGTETEKRLISDLKEAIKGKTELESVECLLNWVQTAFVYEYDNNVWGHDRAFFPEETLYYPYCDCEDRSILLSRLLNDLLGLKTIIVNYPGHLALAVKFSSFVEGDYIDLNGEHYVICDPTYIGAPVGMTMPEMNNNTAKVICIDY